MTKTSSRRPGRPRKSDADATGEYVGFRSPKRLKERLEAAAAANNRSLSTEAQFRLERSFSEEDAMLGAEMREVARTMFLAFFSGGSNAARGKGYPPRSAEWLKDEDCYIAATFDVLTELLAGIPNADPDKIITWATEVKAMVIQKLHDEGRIKLEP